jgi:hypothetical protein
VAYRVTFPIFDADGDLVTGAAGLDSEISGDAGTFADATNEATEIASNSGVYYLDLASGEMNYDTVAIIVKTSTSGAKTTVLVLYPEEVGDTRCDVVQVSGDGTAADNLESYCDGTTPIPANATQVSGDSTAADNLEAACDGNTYNIGGGAVVAASVTGAVGSVTGAVGSVTGAVGSVTGAVGSVTGNVGGNVTGSVGSVATGGITAASIANAAIDAATFAADVDAEIAAMVWNAATASYGTANTYGALLESGNVGGGAIVAASVTGAVGSVTGAVGSVTGAVGSVTGNVGGNIAGSVASVTGAVGSVTGNVGGNVAGTVASVVGAVGSVTGAVGSVTGNVGGNVAGSVASVTGAVTVGTNNDKTGYALSAAGVTAVQSGLSTVTEAQVNAQCDTAISDAALATAANLATVDGVVDSILADTAEIGTAGAGLTALPWNSSWDGEVQSEVDDALEAAITEPANLSATKSVKNFLWYLYARFFHKNTQTATQQITCKADGTTALATRTVSDDGTTQTLGAGA